VSEFNQRVVEALERIANTSERAAVAAEELNTLAKEEREVDDILGGDKLVDPPVCPHCGEINPETQSKGGEGKLLDFVLVSPCGNCGEAIYAIPVGYRIVANYDEAREIRDARKGGA
jgi:hypothetical protein